MTPKQFGKTILCACLLPGLTHCSDPVEVSPQPAEVITYNNQPNANARDASAGGSVMMQAFYWNVPEGGTWWNTVKGKLPSWDAAGFSAIWLPPSTKGKKGAISMGYDPFDYFDFGQYDQHGTIETRFGSNTELQSLISTAHTNNIKVYADIVLNHNSGGDLEFNPRTNTNTYTAFNPASGKFNRSYNDFHPSSVHNNDEGVFGGSPDLCHDKEWVKDWLWNRTDGIGKYYKNTLGYDGWRFDYVKGFGPWVVRDFVNNVGGFAVGEYWDGNATLLKNWVDGTSRTSSAFDFACYYKMDEAFDGNNLNALKSDMLWKKDSYKAVTFVANHDTDIISDKYLAYAYILTHEGLPCVFYRDYEEWLSKTRMNNLLWVHINLAKGGTSILYTDNDEYIARRDGSPGLIVYLNDSNTTLERWITTNWANTRINDYTGNSTWNPTTAADKRVKIQAPPHSYTVWSIDGL